MAKFEFEALIEQVKSLPNEQQQQLRKLLDASLTTTATNGEAADEEKVERELLEAGVIDYVPPPITDADLAQYRQWQPIVVAGKPVSETILEERR